MLSGHYMLLTSSVSQPGDKVLLVSPRTVFSKPTQMSFYYHMWLNSTDSIASLAVYKYSLLRTFEQQLFVTSGNHGNAWQKATVCLPVGTYRIVFVGTVGMTYRSDIGLDDVTFDKTDCTTPNVTQVSGNLLIIITIINRQKPSHNSD